MDTQSPAHAPAAYTPAPAPLDRAACLRLEQALFREWVEADGLGGYASSTVHLCPTRRYHGLLVAPLPGGGERHVFLSRFEEELVGDNKSFPISTGRYPNTYAPEGFQSIESFALQPFPTWRYQIGAVEVHREVLGVWGQHTVLVRWTRRGGPQELKLRLRPLVAFRRNHDLTRENIDLHPKASRLPNGIALRPYPNLPGMSITTATSGFHFSADPVWYRNVEYMAEIRRGFPGQEDLFCPGLLEIPLADGEAVVVACSIQEPPSDCAALWQSEEHFRRTQWKGVQSFQDRLTLSCDSYLYRDAHGRPGILAGFPWFGEWGRDTFLALPGMTIPAERWDLGLEILRGALPFLRDGLLPNTFSADAASSSYRSADAALWWTRAVLLHRLACPDGEAVAAEFRDPLASIAEAYLAGAELGLQVTAQGRLLAGSQDLNATWMDAMVHGDPVTPRSGSPVELQALWYQLLQHLAELDEASGRDEDARRWRGEAEKAGQVLCEDFWLEDLGYLADRIDETGLPDPTVRPNAVLAAAMTYSPLKPSQRSAVVQKALDELLTPRGLRTLSPHDPEYVGRYEGSPEARDAAYHQGTVWPWLLGFLVEAALTVFPPGGARMRRLRKVVDGFSDHLAEHGLGQISEIFDGDPPHRPCGTPAQAWSVSEVLRALHLLDSNQG